MRFINRGSLDIRRTLISPGGRRGKPRPWRRNPTPRGSILLTDHRALAVVSSGHRRFSWCTRANKACLASGAGAVDRGYGGRRTAVESGIEASRMRAQASPARISTGRGVGA